MADALVRLVNAEIGYSRPLLGPIDLELCRGELWGVVGPNGAGKTTLAKTVLGLLRPLGGCVERVATSLRSSYTPQRHRLSALFPVSALDVVLMGRTARLPLGHRVRPVDEQRARDELGRMGMATMADTPFRSLSGGQQQRVLLARALAADPEILVLDEPAEGMDLPGASDVLRFLAEVHATGRMALVMVSHRLEDVISVADHLCFVNQYTKMFDAGPSALLATSEKLSLLYERDIEAYAHAGKPCVRVRGS
ncbi:MAG: metal ABC transporter ATP-binding protein [Polyangiaceae bacterium]|nr:metal ABC transporter ATP-binding protein [Polyangiaceae bacterium]